MTPPSGPAPAPRPVAEAAERERLVAALPRLALDEIRRLPFETSPYGYRRLTLERSASCEIVALHWPDGSRSPLHGHAGSAAVLHVLAGAVLEDRYLPNDPLPSSFSHQRARIVAGGVGYLPSGSFHAVEALEEAWGLHAYTPRLDVPTEQVPAHLAGLLRAAWQRAQSTEPVPLPFYFR
jgi:quercetin dioxygenase-like cupin family protein